MCGIAGQFGPGASASVVQQMTERLRHRGPDGSGFYSAAMCELGHRRLKIIDLSDAAAQPMLHADGHHRIIFNGEIYNYLEIRRELESAGDRFLTSSDTEVLLNAMVRWGTAALSRIVGMFAFALHDSRDRSLLIVRDRFGVKPLFYTTYADGTLSFGSEIKALLCDERVPRRPNIPAVLDFLASGDVGHRAGETFFSGIQALPPAHFMVVKDGSIRIERYWRLDTERNPVSLENAVGEIGNLLDDAVKLRLRSDVPVGTTLSGGIDSSYLLSTVRRFADAPIPVFLCHLPHDPRNEDAFARRVLADIPGVEAHWVLPADDDLGQDLDRLFEHQEEPFHDTSIYAHYCLMREARRSSVPVVLSGQGADEVFVGYPSYYRNYLGSLLREGALSSFRHELFARAAISRESAWSLGLISAYHALGPALRNHVHRLWSARAGVPLRGAATHQFAAERAHFSTNGDGNGNTFDGYLIDAIEKWALPHLLSYDDRNSMAFSIESRQPYLDHRLVQALFRLPAAFRLRDGWTKLLLRRVSEGKIPDEIAWRKDKQGFSTPMSAWMRALGGKMDAVLSKPSWVDEWIDLPAFGQILQRYRDGDNASFQIVWRAFAVRLWSEIFGVSS